MAGKAGVLEERETAILNRTFDLPDTQIRMLMTPKPDMVTVSVTDDLHDIVHTITHTGHSRFPVYDELREKIIGVLYAKDLLNYMVIFQKQGTDLSLKDFLLQEVSETSYFP